MTTLVACSHGTSDLQGRAAIASVVEEVRRILPEERVVAAVVDVEQPQLAEVLTRETDDDVIVVPVLLSVGFHTSVDISTAVVAHARARQTDPLGTHPLIVDILVDRLCTALPDGWHDGDHVVLAAAGSSNPAAADDVEVVADRLRGRVPAPVTVGFASASEPRIHDAVVAARAYGASRVIAVSHVLAPGFFADLIRGSGADIVTGPLAPDGRIAEIIVDRYRTMPR